MDISLYNCTAPVNMLDKSSYLTGTASYTGAVARQNVSMIRPVLKLEESCAIIASSNYAYISEFGRYYQIVDKRADENGLFTITLEVDVLMSFGSDIANLKGIVSRQKDNYDMYLKDSRIPVGARKVMAIRKWGNTIFTSKASGTGAKKSLTMLVLGGD